MGEVQGNLVSLIEAGADDHGPTRVDGHIIRDREGFGVADLGGPEFLIPNDSRIVPKILDIASSGDGRIDESLDEFESVAVFQIDLDLVLLVRTSPVKEHVTAGRHREDVGGSMSPMTPFIPEDSRKHA